MRIVYALVLAACITGGPALAEKVFYSGEPVHTVGITVGGWGSGSALESSERLYNGSRSIKIAAQGLHEGALIGFNDPVELAAESSDGTDYLQLVFSFASSTTATSTGYAGPAIGPMPMPTLAMPTTSSYYGEVEAPSRPKINTIRVVLQSDDGRGIEATSELPNMDDDGWYKVAIPLKALGLKQGESMRVSRILLFSDLPDTFYLGLISAIQDDSPISVDTEGEQIVAIYDEVVFKAEVESGAAIVHYEWNFGDRDTGGVDATGQIVTHKYTKGGEFTARLTVTDAWGIKKPVTVEVPVTVND